MYSNIRAKWQEDRKMKTASRLLIVPLGLLFAFWVFAWQHFSAEKERKPTPFTDKYIGASRGNLGRWYIPPSWFEDYRDMQPYPNIQDYLDLRNPREPAEAAHLALELAMRRNHYMGNSKIPLIVHQTWKDCDSDFWEQSLREGTDAWLAMSVGSGKPSEEVPEMAYILWDDEAVMKFFAVYEPNLWVPFNLLPRPVEKADVFRMAVLKWFGGIYADIDTIPLEHPAFWVHDQDIKNWTDPTTSHSFGLHQPVIPSYIPPLDAPFRPHPWPDSQADLTPASYTKWMTKHAPMSASVAAIMGIEADTRPENDDWWRAGYVWPVQLTNSAVAFAPHHPITSVFLQQVASDVQDKVTSIQHEDPLILTGPPALTRAVKHYSEGSDPYFRWEGVTGLDDAPGGRGKVVSGDVLVLPITGFSPGRGKRNNMGSMPVTDPNARLQHQAQGSWRETRLKSQLGKLCRTTLGMCRDWKKAP